MKILATLLVRNEVEIVADCLRHHLENGIDGFLVTDHASTDGTWDVLQAYRDVILYSQRETQPGYSQDKWVTRMAREAAHFRPDWIAHIDADERWTGFDSLQSVPSGIACVRTGPWRNHLPLGHADSPFHPDLMPYFEIAGKTAPHRSRFVTDGAGDGGKVIHRPMADIQVGMGNHWLHSPNTSHMPWDAVTVHHYPIRSMEQFRFKVVQGAAAVSAQGWGSEIAAHWQNWRMALAHGQLNNVYQGFLLSESEIKNRLLDGTLFLHRRSSNLGLLSSI